MVSDKSLTDAMEADVVGGSPGTVLVEYANGDVESVAEGSLHGALCQLSTLDPSDPIVARGRALDKDEYDGDGIDIEIEIPPGEPLFGTVTVGGRADAVELTGSALGRTLNRIEADLSTDTDDQQQAAGGHGGSRSIASRRRQQGQSDDVDQQDITLSGEIASDVYAVYERRLENRVRANVVNNFTSQFRSRSIDVQDDGWVIEGTYLVTFDGARNYLVDDLDQFTVSGNGVAQTDDTNQAVGLSFDTEPVGVFEIGGEEYSLSAKEQRFMASVQFLLEPSNYLEVNHFEQEVYEAIETAKGDTFDNSKIEEIARTADVSHFVDPKSGLVHRHDIDKHVLRSSFKVSGWVVDELDYSSFDHAGLAELAHREDEFRNAGADVFFDGTPNDDDSRWQDINSTESDAPCPPEVYRKLKAKYGR